MGICKYCGKDAGFLRNKHPECEKHIAESAVRTFQEGVRKDFIKLGMDAAQVDKMLNNAVPNTKAINTENAISGTGNEDRENDAWFQYNTKPERLSISKDELLEKIHTALSLKELKTINDECFPAGSLEETISWNTQPYSLLISILRHLDYTTCEKLFSIIDEYIKQCDDPYCVYMYWGQRIEIYWKNKDEVETAYTEAKRFSHSLIGISQKASEFLKDAFQYERLPENIGYKRMIMILTKEKDYEKIIELCEKAKSEGWKGDWDDKIKKAKQKLEKLKN
jgi:hypothetical protein